MTVQAKIRMQTIGLVADVLQKTLPKETQATILNCLLSCDNDDTLTGHESDVGMKLFEMLHGICGEDVVKMDQEM